MARVNANVELGDLLVVGGITFAGLLLWDHNKNDGKVLSTIKCSLKQLFSKDGDTKSGDDDKKSKLSKTSNEKPQIEGGDSSEPVAHQHEDNRKDNNHPASSPTKQKMNENTESPAQDFSNQEMNKEIQPTQDCDAAGDESSVDAGGEGVCVQNATAETVPETAGKVDAPSTAQAAEKSADKNQDGKTKAEIGKKEQQNNPPEKSKK